MNTTGKSVLKTALGALLALPVLLSVSATLRAGDAARGWKVVGGEGCDEGGWGRSAGACEVREATIETDWKTIRVDGGDNGGITVTGWDRDEILVRARVKAWDRNRDDARETIERIEISTDHQTIRARGPRLRGSGRGWAVSFELMVPRRANLDLETLNGGIGIEDVEGEISAEAVNGGLKLSGLAGDVDVHTTNGGVSVELDGDSWRGRGLDASTTNGGVTVWFPERYSADLETGTVNGSIDFDFPVTVEGKISKRLRTRLGEGGPPIRVVTTNGGVKLKRM